MSQIDIVSNKRSTKWLIAILLVASTVLAYSRVKDLGFVEYDDGPYVTENLHVQTGLEWKNVQWAFTATHDANWHPLTWISHMLDCQLYGLNPAGHHVTNLLIHVLDVLVLFWLLLSTTGAVWRSGLVAALFALHPLNVESVAWVAERKNVLSTLFLLLTVCAYVSYTRRPGVRRYLLVVLMFVMGLMSKPMLVTLPFALFLLDYWPLERVRLPFRRPSNGNDRSGPALSQLILEKVPLVVMALASSVITVIAQKTSGAVGSIQQFSVSSRIQNALVSYAVYLLKMAWPTRLAIFYPFPKSPLPVWQLAFAATVVLIITAAAIWRLGRSKYIAVGWFWYLGTLVPVIGLVQVGSQARADRYAYVPLIGVFVLVAWASAELTGSVTWIRNCLAPASVVILIAFTIVTFRQVGYWSDTATLFGHADDVTENNFLAESSLGALLAREGRLSEATEELNRALQANPYYSLSYLNLGMVCVQEGNLDGGIQNFRTAIEYDSKLVDAYNKLGAALADAGRLDEAVPYLHKVLEMNPNHPTAYANLGSVFERQGKPGEALRCYEKALRLISEDQLPSTTAAADLMSAEINDRAGNLLARQGRLGEAANHFREALRFNPADSGAEQRLKAVLDLASQTPAPK